METIIFKAPQGTKAKLRQINRNISELLREQIEELIRSKTKDSAYEKAERLCGVIKGGARNIATGREYLKQYAPKGHH
jgi:ribosomal protein L11